MTPAKVRDFIPELAQQVGIPEEDYNNMVSFYYKENKRIASNLQELHIILRGLGTLSMQGWLLEDRIKEATLMREKKPADAEELDKEVALYTMARKMWLDEKMAQKDKRNLKKQYYVNKTNSNEAQGTIPDSLEE